jgi:hypothetical protein
MRPGQAGIGREREAAALGAGEVVTDQCSESVGGRAAAVGGRASGRRRRRRRRGRSGCGNPCGKP